MFWFCTTLFVYHPFEPSSAVVVHDKRTVVVCSSKSNADFRPTTSGYPGRIAVAPNRVDTLPYRCGIESYRYIAASRTKTTFSSYLQSLRWKKKGKNGNLRRIVWSNVKNYAVASEWSGTNVFGFWQPARSVLVINSVTN